ncbi:Uma2 family endonuclease [Anaerotalea alkaliphila]|uniref:Uma2 family endonuclease n=1 Tax=Anaerotalea alkaliphila TaxID=2662126 RepID=A0A7X5KMQ8_9FIRM|nr:Uma2 family endonuclease [Anaerotalea alkaliphila]NDL66963.1 Uma2 family endonuclease [Anaerotalea alkaliphila]
MGVCTRKFRTNLGNGLKMLLEGSGSYGLGAKEEAYVAFLEAYASTRDSLEYVDGKVYASPPPGHIHQRVLMRVIHRLLDRFRGEACQAYAAPYDVYFEDLPEKACVRPDAFVMCDPWNIREGKYSGVPALVVEVATTVTRTRDLRVKLDLYRRQGVAEYLVVDPEMETVHYWHFRERELVGQARLGAGQTFCSRRFPGLEIPLEELFR